MLAEWTDIKHVEILLENCNEKVWKKFCVIVEYQTSLILQGKKHVLTLGSRIA